MLLEEEVYGLVEFDLLNVFDKLVDVESINRKSNSQSSKALDAV